VERGAEEPVVWHTIFITAHAVTGALALLAGSVALRRGTLFGTYLWSLVGMEVFLVLAIAVEWTELPAGTRLLFSALAALGVVMLWSAAQARPIRPSRTVLPSARYVERVGFTLVALFDAFIVILVLNAGAPGWLIAAAGVLVAVAGHFVLREARARLAPTATVQA
jgi:hypothetical protein